MPEDATAASPFISKITVPRAADVLADQLRQRILTGELRPGELLPNERDLAEQSGLGRASVREALRLLEGDNLVESKLGRNGGWLVRRPGSESVARSIDVFIRGHQLEFASLLEAREAMEPACAALAARHRTDADIAELELRSFKMKAASDVVDYLLENLRWHLAVVHASHNELLIAVMSALSDAIHATTDLEDFNSNEVRAAALQAHDRVLVAIKDGDADAAHRRMHRHLHAFNVQATETSGTIVPSG